MQLAAAVAHHPGRRHRWGLRRWSSYFGRCPRRLVADLDQLGEILAAVYRWFSVRVSAAGRRTAACCTTSPPAANCLPPALGRRRAVRPPPARAGQRRPPGKPSHRPQRPRNGRRRRAARRRSGALRSCRIRVRGRRGTDSVDGGGRIRPPLEESCGWVMVCGRCAREVDPSAARTPARDHEGSRTGRLARTSPAARHSPTEAHGGQADVATSARSGVQT